jgi:hypothetical protein
MPPMDFPAPWLYLPVPALVNAAHVGGSSR